VHCVFKVIRVKINVRIVKSKQLKSFHFVNLTPFKLSSSIADAKTQSQPPFA
jgi:hypothetical protein